MDAEYTAEHHKNMGIFRGLTYSIASLSAMNDYGPFHPDGTVDWLAASSIAAVMDANVQFASGRNRNQSDARQVSTFAADLWAAARPPVDGGVESFRGRGVGEGEVEEVEGRDWAGLEKDGEAGVWRGTYAFME